MKKQILCIRKEDGKQTYSQDEIISIFENTSDLESLKQAVRNAEDRIYISWASVDAVDRANEKIPIEDVISQQDILLKRNGPITDGHSNKVVGQTLAYKVLEHPETKTLGVLHLDKIFADSELDDQVWKEILTGVKTGSSVGGFNTSISLGKDDNKNYTVLEGFNQYETAIVDTPCNPFALNEAMSVVAKSHQAKECEEKEKACDEEENVLNKQNKESTEDNIQKTNEVDTMTEEIKKQVSEQTEMIKNLSKEVAKLKKEDAPEMKEEEEEVEKMEDEEEKVEKEAEEVASEIEGETKDETQPEDPSAEESNQEEVFKISKEIKSLKKDVSALTGVVKEVVNVMKSSTPRPAAKVEKADSKDNLAMDIATGKKRMKFRDIEKTLRGE